MDQRISLITLGVNDLSISREFYKKLGWKEIDSISNENIAFFQLSGFLIGLFPLNMLLDSQNRKEYKSGGITLSINMRSREEVDSTLKEFIAAGGTLLADVKEYPWAYTTYVADPDGHPWEISHVPGLIPDENGRITV